eukprot:TRINITY_DN6096_c0_g1_i1.p1 TRINITY_DN6096_c0_g1~~TRINITY_DN6096_c0_g1_i1.p1  ORF type:complete len:132 (-),score=25.59 TRINITY_DN6096_c0_g1_i1:103-465(-)
MVTQCSADGSFKPKQCNPSTGYCWCVDGHGNIVNGTDMRGETTLQCQAAGCCVTFGYGDMMKPCCHKYEEAVMPESCIAMGFGGGKAHYPKSTCIEIRALSDCEKRRYLENTRCNGRLVV